MHILVEEDTSSSSESDNESEVRKVENVTTTVEESSNDILCIPSVRRLAKQYNVNQYHEFIS